MREGDNQTSFADDQNRLSVTVDHSAEALTLVMAGEVDARNSQSLASWVAQVLDDAADVDTLVIDMERLSFVSSAGIGAFVTLLVRCQERSLGLELRNASQPVRSVFDVLGFSRFFPFG